MPADNRAALTAATRDRAETTRERARAALRQLDRAGTPVTFAAVAAAADVSRSLLYRDPELHAEIHRLRSRNPLGEHRTPAAEQTSEASLKQRLATALEDNRVLRTEVHQLRDQLAIHLGGHRAAASPAPPRQRAIGPCS
jgi:hypothetical protein